MTLEEAREVAARIWCDKYMSHLTIDPAITEEISKIICKGTSREIDRAGSNA